MTDGPPERRQPAAEEFGLDAVRELLELLSTSDITELQIERGGAKIALKRGLHSQPSQPLAVGPGTATGFHHAPSPTFAASAATPVSAPVESEPLPSGNVIAAPMVGTFYVASSPKDPAFVSEGDEIRVGDKIGIIEAMKMMNELESEFAGRITRILVKNAQPVEYGQPLMVVEPL